MEQTSPAATASTTTADRLILCFQFDLRSLWLVVFSHEVQHWWKSLKVSRQHSTVRSGPDMFQHLYEEVRLSLFQTLKPLQCPVKTYFVDLSSCVSVTNLQAALKVLIHPFCLQTHFAFLWRLLVSHPLCEKPVWCTFKAKTKEHPQKRSANKRLRLYFYSHLIQNQQCKSGRYSQHGLYDWKGEFGTSFPPQHRMGDLVNCQMVPVSGSHVAGALIMIQPTCQQAPSSWNLAGTS